MFLSKILKNMVTHKKKSKKNVTLYFITNITYNEYITSDLRNLSNGMSDVSVSLQSQKQVKI
jgi:hypothetical protein